MCLSLSSFADMKFLTASVRDSCLQVFQVLQVLQENHFKNHL